MTQMVFVRDGAVGEVLGSYLVCNIPCVTPGIEEVVSRCWRAARTWEQPFSG